MKQPLIVLTGPTAVGKTSLSIKLAKAIGGEIISADSMQVYRHMDIGSAKITAHEMEGVPHHLIDVLEPDQDFNVVTFQHMAKEALEEIYSHHRIPIIAGGTGFYIQALLYDIDFKENDDESLVRRELEELAAREGEAAPAVLHAMLEEIDPESAARIHANNVKRVIRAIEYYRLTGERISVHNQEERVKESPYNFLYYVVNTQRPVLYGRIDRRVDQMMEKGLVEEVQALKAMGCHRGQTSMQGLGYKEILDYLDGRCTLDEAVYILKRDTRHFAKRQLTWFKRERDVRWLNLPDFGNDAALVVERIIEDCVGAGIVLQ
ncbi:tRNA (adenosine(37)-N6)-dimethylallyltransferase MiaA [Lachnoclostridium pacaense]|uniref:tRNA (adenosine(37)-N6)-dimethylallyltransferase MiaA n=1 Tax=Enterocloster hominis (ex Hitch et al. 2024) TaxID=1917870 RepID=UPI001D109795|nr:tRNA (adenosine(37)-N6)-dimethylallyltransferase MiaA [Lachnoclostridium pacaense]MCC2818343.1 tRNA (adenosine(37)-N6)-dimethylallyltransferase MiaA [Lachnoclostridium pacaense]